MMKILKTLFALAFTVFATLAVSQAQLITNGSFESPGVTGLNQSTTPTSWTWQAAPTNNDTTTWVTDGGLSFTPSAPDGGQWLMLDARGNALQTPNSQQHGGGYLYQSIGTVTAGSTYDWSFTLGTRSDELVPANTPFSVGLYTTSDGNPGDPIVLLDVVTEADFTFDTGGTLANADIDFDLNDYTHQFTSSWVAPALNDGDALYFRIGVDDNGTTAANQFLFDDVTVIPEPSTAALLGLALGGLYFLRRRPA